MSDSVSILEAIESQGDMLRLNPNCKPLARLYLTKSQGIMVCREAQARGLLPPSELLQPSVWGFEYRGVKTLWPKFDRRVLRG